MLVYCKRQRVYSPEINIIIVRYQINMGILCCRYALGGYDGSAMVSSVEIYDSRMDSWISVDPMKEARGYSAAVVLKESIYAIAGVAEGHRILDTVSYLLPCLMPFLDSCNDLTVCVLLIMT